MFGRILFPGISAASDASAHFLPANLSQQELENTSAFRGREVRWQRGTTRSLKSSPKLFILLDFFRTCQPSSRVCLNHSYREVGWQILFYDSRPDTKRASFSNYAEVVNRSVSTSLEAPPTLREMSRNAAFPGGWPSGTAFIVGTVDSVFSWAFACSGLTNQLAAPLRLA